MATWWELTFTGEPTEADLEHVAELVGKGFTSGQLVNEDVPPADVLSRPITPADVAAYPAYFISGPGREIASTTECAHGYNLTDSCPACP